MHNTLKLLTLFMMTVIVGCGASIPTIDPFKMDIQQGNVVTSEMLLKLRPGMTKAQVQYIMGTPLLVDSFHSNRWDYFYQLRKQGKIVNQRRVILDFDGDSLARVRGDVVPEGTDVDALMQAKTGAEQKVESEKKADSAEPFVEVIEEPVIKSVDAAEVKAVDVAEPVEAEVVIEAPAAEVAAEAEQVTAAIVEPMKGELVEAVTPSSEVIDAVVEEKAVVEPTVAQEKVLETPVDVVPEVKLKDVVEAKASVEAIKVEATPEVEVAPKMAAPEKSQIPVPPVIETAPSKLAPAKKAVIPAPPVMGPVAKTVKSVPAPMEVAPVVEPSVPDVKAAEKVEQVVGAVKEVPVVSVQSVPEVPVAPMPTSRTLGDKAVFRLERELDTSRIKPAMPTTETLPEVKSKASEVVNQKAQSDTNASSDSLPYEEEPSFFERALEKIGF